MTKRILPSGKIIKGEVSPRFGFRILVPRSFKKRVMDKMHLPNHLGARKTRSLVADSYIWEGMNADVTKYVRACLKCAKSKVLTPCCYPMIVPLGGRRANLRGWQAQSCMTIVAL